MSGKNSIQVAIKVRPIMRKEKDTPWRIVDNSIQLIDVQTEPYYFGKFGKNIVILCNKT